MLNNYISERISATAGPETLELSTAKDPYAEEAVGRSGPGLEVGQELNKILRICDLTGLTQEEGVGRFILHLNKVGLECLRVNAG